MKKLFFLSLVCLFTVNVLLAEQRTKTVIKKEGDSLVIYEIVVNRTITIKYPLIPEGVPDSIGLKIMQAGHGQYTTQAKTEEIYSFSFWPLRIKSGHNFKQITWHYVSGKWLKPIEKVIPIQLKFDFWVSFFSLCFVMLCILVVTLLNRFNQWIKKRNRKVLVFYLAILLSSAMAGLVGYYINQDLGVFAGVSAGVFAGVSAGVSDGVFAGVFVGGFAGVLSGVSDGVFVEDNPITAINYILFLAISCIVSYLLALFISIIKNKYFNKKVVQPELTNEVKQS